jgi:preprotein translocase subunit SecG
MAERTKGWKHWSTNEKVAAVILLSVLTIAIILLGLVLYEPPTGPGLCGAFGATPCPGRENLNFVSATVDSPTNMTVQILNIGSVAISLVSYNVKSTYSQPYQSNNWSGPTLGPNTYATINLLIDGNTFTFQSGTYYSITFMTSRNFQFSSTLKAS